MLKDLFDKKECFKLVCGAGNEDAAEVEKLVTIYSLAGCNFLTFVLNLKLLMLLKEDWKELE